MKKDNLEKLDLTLYSTKLLNGLEIYIVPKENVNSVYATFSTKYGSNIVEFKPNGKDKMIKVPYGIAHFLEHKMFEQKDGKDPFSFYSQRGCDANANTSNTKTTYLFCGSNSFEENIMYLLDYVQSPYFTDENVEKEKGIIEQEIKMYNDDPYFRIYDGLIKNAFVKHPIKYPVTGTVQDINSITKEDLYNCYNTFYNPSNMFLVITGNVDPKESINLIKINQSDKTFDKQDAIEIKKYIEPSKVEKTSEKAKMDVVIPKMGIAYKIDISKTKLDMNDVKTYIAMLFDLKFGPTSVLSEQLKKDNLTTSDIEISIVNTDKHILVMLIFESKDVKKVSSLIEEELKDLTIDESDFERKKKVRKSNCIYRSDSVYSINVKLMNNIMNYGKVILDDYEKIDSYNMKDFNKVIKNINLDNKTTYIVEK